MRGLLALVGLVATVSAQAVTDLIVPSSTPQAGCLNSKEGTFSISILNATEYNRTEPTPSRRSRDLRARQAVALTLTLTGGVLLDQQNRTGYIASNYQFQFDGPVQAGAIYTAGWGICGDGVLSLGGQTTFYQCLSGDFYNLYDRNWAPENCVEIYIVTSGTGSAYSTAPPGPESTGASENTIVNGGGTSSGSATAAATSASASASEAVSSASSSASAAATSASSSVSEAASSVSSSASEAVSSASAAASSATGSAPSINSSAFAAQATTVPQQLIAWAAGAAGALALL